MGGATHNLPAEVSSFVGRRGEIEALCQLLAPTEAGGPSGGYEGARLVTLTGPGGIGKSRLALRAARRLAPRFPDGVWLIDLATVGAGGGAAAVVQAVRDALGIAEAAEGASAGAGAGPTETVVDALRARRALLVLDGCEHVVSPAADLAAALLRRAPEVHLLTTSREPLDVRGERVVRVEPLAMSEETGASGAAPSEAALLFLERARAAAPAFEAGDGDAAAIEELCHRLDGIPLAIELAAARANVLSVGQILERLRDRFRLLAGGPRGVQSRQQTLRAALDWSWDLLAEPERALLARLSVFRGSFGLEAVEAVAPPSAAGPDALDALDVLAQLVKKSLVVATTAAGRAARYALLDTVRAYGADRLAARGDEESAVAAHAAHYLTIADRAAARLHGPEQGEWLRRLDGEHDNLRAAFDRALERRQTELALRLGGALWWYWVVRGHFYEGAERLERTLALGADESRREQALLRAGVLVGAAYLDVRIGPAERGAAATLARVEPLVMEAAALFRRHGDARGEAHALSVMGTLVASTMPARGSRGSPDESWSDGCVALLESNLPLARGAGDRWLTALVVNTLGVIDRNTGNGERGRARIEEALALRREIGDLWGIATSLNDLGHLAHAKGDDVTARVRYEESLAIRRELGDAFGLIMSTFRLANVHSAAGEYGRARVLLEECLPIARRAAPWVADTWVAALQGTVAVGEGDLDEARRQVGEALRSVRERGREMPFPMVFALRGAARIAAAKRQWRRALQLAGATQAHAQPSIGQPVGNRNGAFGPSDTASFDLAMAPAHAALGPDEAAKATAEGAALTLEDAVAFALTEEPAAAEAVAAARPTNGAPSAAGPLSPRELEVAELVTQGLTNPQIAARLVISERTAARHVEHILNKLALSTRAQIAAWVVRRAQSSS